MVFKYFENMRFTGRRFDIPELLFFIFFFYFFLKMFLFIGTQVLLLI
jgi:hypothetical protein